MKALEFTLVCGSRKPGGGKRTGYVVALGQDGEIYPVSPELIEKVDSFKAMVELGFSREELIGNDDCLRRFYGLNTNYGKVDAVCQKAGLSGALLGVIAYDWINRYPQMIEFFKTQMKRHCKGVPDAMWVAHQSFLGVATKSMVIRSRNRVKGCRLFKEEKLRASIPRAIDLQLAAIEIYMNMALEDKRGNQRQVNHKAQGVSTSMVLSIRSRPEYFGMDMHRVGDAIRADQLKVALRMIDQMGAWTGELS